MWELKVVSDSNSELLYFENKSILIKYLKNKELLGFLIAENDEEILIETPSKVFQAKLKRI